MTREATLTAGINLDASLGLEIGPLAHPVVAKSEGDILYVDYTDTGTLQKRYVDDPYIDPADIVEVDAVWGEQTLAEAIGRERKVDYVIASHVIEHVPDLITWLAEIEAVLKADGVIRLAIPDRRYCFDYFRPETTLADIVYPYLIQARVPQPREILGFTLNKAEVDVGDAWRDEINDDLERDFTFEGSLALARDTIENGTYHDVHCWVFTPTSFAGLMEDLCRNGLSHLGCETLTTTQLGHFEFFATLRRIDDPDDRVESWRRAKEALPVVEYPWELHGSPPGDTDTTQDKATTDEVAQLTEVVNASEERVRQLEHELANANALVARYQNSPWWRLTAPGRIMVTRWRERRSSNA